MHTHSKHPRMSPRARIALAYLIAITWIAAFAACVTLTVVNWR